MKPALQLRFSQQLTMTPQLQQAIKLLQLSSQELEVKIIEALESNPMLERAENVEEPAQESGEDDDREVIGSTAEENLADWEHTPAQPASGATGPRRNYDGSDRQQEIPDDDDDDLIDHLLWQLNLSHASPKDVAVGIAIIEAINDDGYLTESLSGLQATLAPDHDVDEDEIEAMLHRVQRFDPVGVAARSLEECLLVQMDLMDEDTPGYALARKIIQDHLGTLAQQDLGTLKKALSCTEDDLRTAIELVRSLDPKPGARISAVATEYVRPDVIVERAPDGGWRVRLHGNQYPQIAINEYYAGLISKAKKEDAEYLRGQLQEARWLLKSLETRSDTLMRVATAIVDHQQAFFDQGPEAMKPLVLREIAEIIDMHESTVSRVTTRKYMLTPRGVFELKYFFSSHVGTSDGGECSATAIQAMIRKLIEEEPAKKPLSDAKIASILNDRGIDVARRTVAKYRESMNIPASSKRKRLI